MNVALRLLTGKVAPVQGFRQALGFSTVRIIPPIPHIRLHPVLVRNTYKWAKPLKLEPKQSSLVYQAIWNRSILSVLLCGCS